MVTKDTRTQNNENNTDSDVLTQWVWVKLDNLGMNDMPQNWS